MKSQFFLYSKLAQDIHGDWVERSYIYRYLSDAAGLEEIIWEWMCNLNGHTPLGRMTLAEVSISPYPFHNITNNIVKLDFKDFYLSKYSDKYRGVYEI